VNIGPSRVAGAESATAGVAPRLGFRLVHVLLIAAAVVIVPIAAFLVAVYPSLCVLAVAVAATIALSVRAPPYAVAVVLLLFGAEGSIKERLAVDLPPFGVAPETIGAAALDLAFVSAVAGVILADRGRSLVAIWRGAGRGARVALVLLGSWWGLSLLQIPVSGNTVLGLSGFRLTQAYVLGALAGLALLSKRRSERMVLCFIGVLLLVSAYAAVRAVVGPSAGERAFALSKLTTPLVPAGGQHVFRNVGSFSGAIGLASFLVPAGAFAFALGLLSPRFRLVCWFVASFATVAVVGTQIRAGLVALGVGIFLVAVLRLSQLQVSHRVKIAVATAVVALLGLGGTFLVSSGFEQRGEGIANPLSDPSVRSRLKIWEDSLRIVKAHPLGTGLGTVGRATATSTTFATTTDNSYVKIFREQGVPGGLLFVFGVFGTSIAAGRRFLRVGLRSRPLGVAALGGFVSLLVLGLSSEAIEQPGKVLWWVLLGLCCWEAFGRSSEPSAGRTWGSMKMPLWKSDSAASSQADREPSPDGSSRQLPRRARWPYLLAGFALAVLLVLAVELARSTRFGASAQVSPTTPAGNGAAATGHGRFRVNLVENPNFESNASSWSTSPAFKIRRSTKLDRRGDSSLASTRVRASSTGRNAGFTELVFPAAGTYRARVWVYLPTNYNGGPPAVFLEGYAGSRLLAQQIGDPSRRGEWQLVWSDYRLAPGSLAGSLVLRAIGSLPTIGKALYWDDADVLISVRNYVINSGFETNLAFWADPPAFAIARSTDHSAEGHASLVSTRERRQPRDGNNGFAFLALQRAGSYRVEASVYLPHGYNGGPPTVDLEGYAGSRVLAQKVGNPTRRGKWQRVWTDYKVAPEDLAGLVVLRIAGSLPSLEKPIFWDEVFVTARASRAAVPIANIHAESRWLRELLADNQLDQGMFLALGRNLYRPDRVALSPGQRRGVFSFTLGIPGRTPDEARRLAGALTSELESASGRSRVGRVSAALQTAETQLATKRLSSGRRALLAQRVSNFQAFLVAPSAGLVAGPGGVRVAAPSRWADRLVDALPGSLPPRPNPVWACLAAVLCASGLLATVRIWACRTPAVGRRSLVQNPALCPQHLSPPRSPDDV